MIPLPVLLVTAGATISGGLAGAVLLRPRPELPTESTPPRPASSVAAVPTRRFAPLVEAAGMAAAGGLTAADVLAVELGEVRVSMLLSGARTAAPGVDDAGNRWSWQPGSRPETEAAPLPFVSIGAGQDGKLFVNLAATGGMVVTGARHRVEPVIAAMTDGLETALGGVVVAGWVEDPVGWIEEHRRSGALFLCGGSRPVAGAWSLRVEDGVGQLEPLGLSVQLTADAGPEAARRALDPLIVQVRVLGPVEVTNAAGEAIVGREAELLAYLACNRDGVNEDRARTALWPQREPGRRSFNNRVSAARRQLGVLPDGALALPHLTGDRRYRLDRRVRTDAEQFDELVEDGRLVEALRLVRGRPFDTVGFDWAFLDGWVSRIERRVVRVAHQAAAEALGAGDIDASLWAADQGLKAAPGDELLFRDRMLAWDAAGNPAAVKSVMEELRAHIDESPAKGLHPETVELYRRCGRNAVRTLNS